MVLVCRNANKTCPKKKKIKKKLWYIYTMGYYSAIKRNKLVPFAEMSIDLETVIQNKVSQKEKNKYHIISFICGI